MKVNEYKVLVECVEEGARYGVFRAFKHTDEPSIEKIVSEVEAAVMNAICEKFIFPETISEDF
jgi:hypothetical protein